MPKIIYLPLEHIEMRYTIYMDKVICDYLNKSDKEYIRIYPQIPAREIKAGSFLDAPTTIEFKSKQIAKVAEMYHTGEIEDGDIIFTSDIWFPGLESIAYLNYFCKKNVKVRGILHAGSFTDTDFVRDMERWAKNFEDVIFDIADKVFVFSEFIKKDVLKKRIINEDKLIVTGQALDDKEFMQYKSDEKENIVVFNGRNVDEKQPWLFEKLKETITNDWLCYLEKPFKEPKFVNTHSLKLPKKEYYQLLGKSKVVVSFALQENFGIGVNEAVKLGCVPILPNRLVYKEFYNKEYLYNNFNECVELVQKALKGELSQTESKYKFQIEKWFE
jgi:glycosyltransferase involved in cell wall biosynthesis